MRTQKVLSQEGTSLLVSFSLSLNIHYNQTISVAGLLDCSVTHTCFPLPVTPCLFFCGTGAAHSNLYAAVLPTSVRVPSALPITLVANLSLLVTMIAPGAAVFTTRLLLLLLLPYSRIRYLLPRIASLDGPQLQSIRRLCHVVSNLWYLDEALSQILFVGGPPISLVNILI